MGRSGPLGNRMKQYESVQTSNCLMRRMPVIIRVDGRAFHTLTASMDKPFDQLFMDWMVDSAKSAAEEMQGFKCGYVQSDEASFLLTDFDSFTTEPWFGYDLCKVVSISASLMTVEFSNRLPLRKRVTFDARAFNVPLDDVANYFLWRAKDWERNSLQMYCQAHFSHKQLHSKGHEEMHEMLHGIGKNWTKDLSEIERNGTFLIKVPGGRDIIERTDVNPHYADIANLLKPLLDFNTDPADVETP